MRNLPRPYLCSSMRVCLFSLALYDTSSSGQFGYDCLTAVVITSPVLGIHWATWIRRWVVFIEPGKLGAIFLEMPFLFPFLPPFPILLLLGQLMFSHRSTSLCSFIFFLILFSPRFILDRFYTVSSNSLIFSSALSNLLLIQSLIFHLTHCSIHLYKFNLGHLYLLGLHLTF